MSNHHLSCEITINFVVFYGLECGCIMYLYELILFIIITIITIFRRSLIYQRLTRKRC